MPSVGFEPTISAGERPQTYAVDRAATGTGIYTGLLKMAVGVLTTCHTQYTWDSSMCIFLFNRTTLQVFVTYLTGVLYVHPLWFYKHQRDNRVRSTQNAFSLLFATILVNCAPSGEMHNYCTPHIIKENYENFLILRCNYILLSQVYSVRQVVKTPTVILNNPVYKAQLLTCFCRLPYKKRVTNSQNSLASVLWPRTMFVRAAKHCAQNLSRTDPWLTHCGRVTQICVFTLQLCRTGDADLRF